MDCVTSLAGMNISIDQLKVDTAYSGTQKCISCRRKNVFLFLSALEAVLKAKGFKARPGAMEAATAVYPAS